MAKKPIHLVRVQEKDIGDGVDHNKFYDMFERNGECHSLYGRRKDGYEFGKSGALAVKPLSMWDSILKSKLAKGYEDLSYLYEDAIVNVISSGSDADMYAPISDKSVANIIARLQKYANDVITSNYSVKSASVTKAMIDETQKYIDSLSFAQSIEEFNAILKGVFKIISRSMRSVNSCLITEQNPEYRNYLQNPQAYLKSVIEREQDLLDVMRGQVITPVKGQKVKTVAGDKKTILELNGIEMSNVTDKDIALIKSKLGPDAYMFKNAWKVRNKQQYKNYMRYCTENEIKPHGRHTKLLWHGTRNENIWSILKTGLVLRPTNSVITGKMFGYGIYFAPLARKSIGYTSLSGSYWAKGGSNTAFMILHEVAYGTPYDVHSFDSKLKTFDYRALRTACPTANCLHAHSGTMLRNDEIVVYKEEQLNPVYIVELYK